MQPKMPCFNDAVRDGYCLHELDKSNVIASLLHTGHYRIDQDHERIAQAILEFVEFIKHRVHQDTPDMVLVLYKVQKKFDKIFKQIVHHFEAEEELMQRYHYPKLRQHKHEHDASLDELEELEEMLMDMTRRIDWEDVKRDMLQMLSKHILADLELREFFQAYKLSYFECSDQI